jgi:hypothetical protein
MDEAIFILFSQILWYKKIGHIFPKKLAKLIEFTSKKQNIPRVSQILESKKYKICWGKNIVKEGPCLERGDILGLN